MSLRFRFFTDRFNFVQVLLCRILCTAEAIVNFKGSVSNISGIVQTEPFVCQFSLQFLVLLCQCIDLHLELVYNFDQLCPVQSLKFLVRHIICSPNAVARFQFCMIANGALQRCYTTKDGRIEFCRPLSFLKLKHRASFFCPAILCHVFPIKLRFSGLQETEIITSYQVGINTIIGGIMPENIFSTNRFQRIL